ncbi:MAG TPA: plastocyanin/azurin family copper-binding protein, partial [Longimicrobiales bacterium]|nr:plastocyanin/azurin family copper-binding protein [Longimicrobiales bacterium]
WRNTSDVLHTVTADPASAVERDNVVLPETAEPFNSGDMPPGAEFSHRFTVPGEYRYVCVPHEMAGMVGVVIVE